jgi:hypothetical protein
MAVAGNLGTDLVKAPGEPRLWYYLAGVLAVIGGLALLLSARVRRAIKNNEIITLSITKLPDRAKALVVFVSKGPGSSSALDAALYHADNDMLQDLWIITSEEARDDADRVRREVLSLHPNVTVHPPVYVMNVHDIGEAKTEVEIVRRKCLLKYKSEKEIICDFTGLTKHMSAGMIFACAPKEARLQYMLPKRFLPDGRADFTAGPSDPIEVEIAYQVEPDS